MDIEILSWGIILVSIVISLLSRWYINHTYKKYSNVFNENGVNGAEAARRILDSNNLEGDAVNSVAGTLSDHYNPANKSVNLSEKIYTEKSVASVAIAAHECGHAIQDKEDYSWYKIRASLVPIVNFVTYAAYIFFAISVILQLADLIGLSIVLVSCSLLFQVVTLPVEFDASKRGLAKLEEYSLIEGDEESGASSVLRAAALTYVASLLSSILNLIRLIMVYDDRRK